MLWIQLVFQVIYVLLPRKKQFPINRVSKAPLPCTSSLTITTASSYFVMRVIEILFKKSNISLIDPKCITNKLLRTFIFRKKGSFSLNSSTSFEIGSS
jgi:hypothetical protein